MTTTTNFSALILTLQDLERERLARQTRIGETWNRWYEAASKAGEQPDTTPPAQIAQASRDSDMKHRQAAQRLYQQHASALRTEFETRIAAIRSLYASLVTEMEALRAFENGAHDFAQRCGIAFAPRLADASITVEGFSNWEIRADRVLRPTPRPTPASPVDLDRLLADVAS